MRLAFLLPAILAATSVFSTAYADTLPVGTYSLLANTTASGIHQSIDQGTLSGFLTFDVNSQITFADLLFKDTTDGLSFTFTVAGPTTYTSPPGLLSATIKNAGNPSIEYFFSISTLPIAGVYRLTCGTDCLNDVEIPNATGTTTLNEEVLGNIAPLAVTPEPSTLALLGTGLVAGVGMLRRRTV